MSKPCKQCPVALTIAGSDSGGNAGIQADLRAFHVFGVHGCTAITALTAQNPTSVSHVHPTTPENLTAQLSQISAAYNVGAIKTGMLVNASLIEAVHRHLQDSPIPLIIDPVMIATSGAKLIDDDAIAALKDLLHHATLITPNIPEAYALAERTTPINDQFSMIDTAHGLAHSYQCAILLKGGHSASHPAQDIFYDGHATYLIQTPTVHNPISTHGTGCSLSAALAAAISRDPTAPLLDAIIAAKAYIYAAIQGGVRIGPHDGVLGTPTSIDTSIVSVETI